MTLEYDYATSTSIRIAEHFDDGRGFEGSGRNEL